MITVTRINNTQFVINSDWIETVESTPDTVITLTNGKKYIVTEKVDEVIDKVIEYKQKSFYLNRTINTSSINDDK
ncbi:MAG: flagellar FlbD family protein [Acetivibrionales bacterium]|jgi:flagellar protein FlbD|nr:flagellar FlbD family protein [Clostridiaceae bacterium]